MGAGDYLPVRRGGSSKKRLTKEEKAKLLALYRKSRQYSELAKKEQEKNLPEAEEMMDAFLKEQE